MDVDAALPTSASGPGSSPNPAATVWKLRWLTPGVCRLLFVLILAAGFLGHLYYLHNDCPIDLSGDEAQYWDWSRQLDLSYYSKGPLVAYIIRLSCAIFGDYMPAVRYPALVLGALTQIVTYLLALRLFRSDRVALGTVLLYHIVPLFVAGSVLMTIDPPFFLCWALATYLLAIALFDGRRWPWPAIGVVVGIGFLAKYAMFLWFVPVLLFLLIDRQSRHWLRTRWPWLAIGIAALFTTQVIVWNARHDWVSFQHVTTQTGTNKSGKFSLTNVLEFVGGQIGILGPGIALIMFAATVQAFRRRPANGALAPSPGTPGEGWGGGLFKSQISNLKSQIAEEPLRSPSPGVPEEGTTRRPTMTSAVANHDFARETRFLATIGAVFFAFTLFTSFRTKVQMNWPAPAYFTLLILCAWFLSTRLANRRAWRPWRPWFWLSVLFGLAVIPIAHNPAVLYPAINWLSPKVVGVRHDWLDKGGVRGWIAKRLPRDGLTVRHADFTAKLKGWEEFGQELSRELNKLRPGAFVLCHDYQQSAELAFYLKGQPKTYYAGSYYQRNPGRMTQYDIWPDRSLEPTSPLVGHDAIFLGHIYKPTPDLLRAFDQVIGPVSLTYRRVWGVRLLLPEVQSFVYEEKENGTVVRTFRYFLCRGFKGMKRSAELPK